MENFRDYWAVVSQDKRVLDWTQLKSKVLLSGALLFVITAVIVSQLPFRAIEPLFTGLAIAWPRLPRNLKS